jgi:hypothetical protein
MKKMRQFLKGAKAKVGAIATGVVVTTGTALADGALGDDFAVDTAPVLTVAGVILTAIGGIWAVKKVIALGNKS